MRQRLREISFDYLKPEPSEDEDGNPILISRFEKDLNELKNPKDRLMIFMNAMEFIEPKMRAMDMTMEMEMSKTNRMAIILGEENMK